MFSVCHKWPKKDDRVNDRCRFERREPEFDDAKVDERLSKGTQKCDFRTFVRGNDFIFWLHIYPNLEVSFHIINRGVEKNLQWDDLHVFPTL